MDVGWVQAEGLQCYCTYVSGVPDRLPTKMGTETRVVSKQLPFSQSFKSLLSCDIFKSKLKHVDMSDNVHTTSKGKYV